MKLNVVAYPEEIRKPGTYTIREVKRTWNEIIIVTEPRGSLRIEYVEWMDGPDPVPENTDLARLIKAFSDETDAWLGKRVRVTFKAGICRIDPVQSAQNSAEQPRVEKGVT
jgi:hypothetical protein